ncbi:MAG: hypothetical protein V7L23_24515 [Nostoc sp.]|uniref:hypothetical protein n=1 Tax=Nostoc sp. TaxID=1180 RepID=UPI002FF1D42D
MCEKAEEQRSRGAEEQRSRGAEEQRSRGEKPRHLRVGLQPRKLGSKGAIAPLAGVSVAGRSTALNLIFFVKN